MTYLPAAPRPPAFRWTWPVGALVVMATALAGCGSSLFTASTTPSSSVSSSPAPAPPIGEVAVAFPVVACTTSAGTSLGSQGWKPSILLAPIPTALVDKVEFYSDGTHILLGPTGWSCAQAPGTGSASGLVVYPSSLPSPPVNGAPEPGTQGVFATFDTTGDIRGILLVCPFFTLPAWQMHEAGCVGSKPDGEHSSMPTPDVASVTDPAGVVGSLEGSGGVGTVTGTVIFPQAEPAVTDGSAVAVAAESCSIPDASLCPTVLSDFDVREFPVSAPTYQPVASPARTSDTPPATSAPSTTVPAPPTTSTSTAPPQTTDPTETTKPSATSTAASTASDT